MNCDKTLEMSSAIYMNGCGCECLWNALQTEQTASHTKETERDFNYEKWPVGMTYVPMQSWEELFDLDKGLRAGTIFPSLRLPFRGGGR